ncbi:MAG: hypothetical protein ACK5CG_08315 [Aphanizomenon sp.]|nr:hypothetical protein [Aphanizomenon flos-aquae UKL13-PB]MBO1061745.1 hypothetical protein [Aphanizomenon flos-aquae CP01]
MGSTLSATITRSKNIFSLPNSTFDSYTAFSAEDTKLNHETLVVRASCPLDMYLITPGSAVLSVLLFRVEFVGDYLKQIQLQDCPSKTKKREIENSTPLFNSSNNYELISF